jgi:hypothetical protein
MFDFTAEKPKDKPVVSTLEGRHIPIPYVDKDSGDFNLAMVEVRKPPSPIEIPKEQELVESIVGFCSGCRMQCQMTFPDGFRAKDGDHALQGKAIPAFCPRCKAMREFLPAATYQNTPLVMRNQKHMRDARGIKDGGIR